MKFVVSVGVEVSNPSEPQEGNYCTLDSIFLEHLKISLAILPTEKFAML